MGAVLAQDAEGDRVSEIPSRFFQTQDSKGYFWQIAENGAITSGETQYLQSGLNLIVDGSAFAPTTALVRSPDLYPESAGVTLEEKRESLELERDLWMDRERGGIRVLDTIQNTGSETAKVEVVLRNTYPFAWQSLHGADGDLLSKDPVLSLDERDFGMVVHFSAAEGRHDTFLVIGGGEESLHPRLTASNNRRELSLVYQLEVPAGGSRSLLHVISQQALPDMDKVGGAFASWFARNELVNPGVSDAQQQTVVNFPKSAFPEESAAAGGLETLLSLNGLLDPLGLVRRSEDVHWISPSNRIAGTIAEVESLKVQANHVGETLIPLASIAAIQGGSGIGRKPVFYLRNGEVRVGEVIEGALTIQANGEEEARPIDFASINLVLLRQAAEDGAEVATSTYFAQLMDQSVFAINGETAMLPVTTPWGVRERSISTLLEMAHVSRPLPTHRFLTEEGSVLSGFLSDAPIALDLLTGGSLEIPSYLLDRLWKAGSRQLSVSDYGDEWLGIDEISTGSRGGLLIRGNTFLQGSLAEKTVRLIDGNGDLEIDSSSIQSIERDISEGTANLVLNLANGESLTGEFSSPFLSILWEGTPLDVPVESILAFRLPSPSPTE